MRVPPIIWRCTWRHTSSSPNRVAPDLSERARVINAASGGACPERLDPDQAGRLLERRRELRLARRESRERAARNRSLAGVSLEAVRSVRRALGATGASNHVGVRVDATA